MAELLIDPEQAVAGPAGPVPPRAERSIRRTATIDMTWPSGPGGKLRLTGHARDAVTGEAGTSPVVVDAARMEAGIGERRVIEDIAADPAPDGLDKLVGERGGGHLRVALAEHFPEERQRGTLLYLMLDDISGTSLIGGVVWARWPDLALSRSGPGPDMEGVCIGFRPGSHALVEVSRSQGPPRVRPVPSLVHTEDPGGWHPLPDLPAIGSRRARHIEVRVQGGKVLIDAGFQDSATDPDHGRVGIHEYRIRASADRETLVLDTLEPVAHVLPFRECPAAVGTASAMIGSPLGDLRDSVLEQLSASRGCTHLNDALRSLAEVPVLVEKLESAPH